MQKTFLIILISLSVGCNELPKFPNITKWYLDFPNQKTTGYLLKDPVHMIYEQKETLDIQSTNGMYCMSVEDEIAVSNWIVDVRKKYEEIKNCEKLINGN